MSQIKHRLSKSDQLTIVIDGCILLLSRKMRDLGIRNFKELYNFGVQKELDLVQEKKFFNKRFVNKEGIRFSSGIRLSRNV